MRSGRPGRTRRRRGLAWVALVALLFQQLGMAALACEIVELPPLPQPTMAHCEQGAGHEPPMDEACVRSCSPDVSTSSQDRTGKVPPLALPPPSMALEAAQMMTVAGVCADLPAHAAGPPPTLLFCSLLI